MLALGARNQTLLQGHKYALFTFKSSVCRQIVKLVGGIWKRRQASVQSQASIRLNKAGSVVERGQKVKLKARISNSRSKKVVWKSSKRRVATVNRNGQVIARGKGTAVITAKIAGTNVYAQSVVTVKNYITMRVRTTGYCNCRSCAGKWAGCATASGTRPKEKRTIAVDKHLIHLGTKVKIGNIIYTAEDTGSAIKGKRIDVYYASHRKATAHGVKYQKIKVYI